MDQAALIRLFNECFGESEGTFLVGGADEPYYAPAAASDSGQPARLFCRSDYAASALHEIAHWCLASSQQRLLPDFGYEYVAPPRSRPQQTAFLQAELRVQSLERVLSTSAGLPFRISSDDFDPDNADLAAQFARDVAKYEAVTCAWMAQSLGVRANHFNHILLRHSALPTSEVTVFNRSQTSKSAVRQSELSVGQS
jgi:elongation factor P hydroxylase